MLNCPAAITIRYNPDMFWYMFFHAFHLWKMIPKITRNDTILRFSFISYTTSVITVFLTSTLSQFSSISTD